MKSKHAAYIILFYNNYFMISPEYNNEQEVHIADEIRDLIVFFDGQTQYKNPRIKAIVKTKLQEAMLWAGEINNNF